MFKDFTVKKYLSIYLILFGTIVTYLLLYFEYDETPVAIRTMYCTVRVLFTVSYLVSCYLYLRDSKSQVAAYFSIGVFYIEAAFCQWYMPYYFLSFFQIALASAFLLPIKRYHYQILTLSGLALMLFSILSNWNSFVHQVKSPSQVDVISILSISTILFIFFNFKYSKAMDSKAEAISKFSIIGQNTHHIIHDLKSLFQVPKLLMEELGALEDMNEKSKQLFEELRVSLGDLEARIRLINHFAKREVNEQVIDIHRVVSKTNKLFANKFSAIEFTILQSNEFVSNEDILSQILMSLLINSHEQFLKNNQVEMKVSVIIENKKIIYTDNGGGFSEKSLKALRSSVVYTDKATGSGMGLLLMQNLADTINLKVKFANSASGVSIAFVKP